MHTAAIPKRSARNSPTAATPFPGPSFASAAAIPCFIHTKVQPQMTVTSRRAVTAFHAVRRRGGSSGADMEAAEGYPRAGVAQGPLAVLACRRALEVMKHARPAVLLALLLLAGCAATDRQVIDHAETIHTDLKAAVMDDPDLRAYFKAIGDRIVTAGLEEDRLHPNVPATHRVKDQDNAWMFQ